MVDKKTKNSRSDILDQPMMAKMLDVAPNIITVHDLVGTCLYTNEKNLELHGYTRDEFMNINLHELDVPESATLIKERIEIIKKNDGATFVIWHYRKDRTEIPLEVFAKIIDWYGTLAMMTVATDITERLKAEEAIKESEEKFRNLFKHHSAVKLIMDPDDGRIIEANEAAVIFYGWTEEELKQKTVFDLNAPQQNKTLNKIEKVTAGKQNRFVFLNRKADGTTVDVEVFSTKIISGKKDFIHCVIHDITEQQRAENEKVALQIQLVQAQKMESIGRLAGGVAHDFNNMLSVILGRVELAMMKTDSKDPVFMELEEIKIAAERSSALTSQLLAFARKQVVVPKVISVNEELDKIYLMLKKLVGENIDLVRNKGKDIWNILLDPSQFDQILTNLCVNSKDAITENGKIEIETENVTISEETVHLYQKIRDGNYVLIKVSDNGAGMDSNILEHVFEPFFTTKEVGRGTGLGLATIYGIVKQNNGHIYVDSELGHGTILKILFPKVQKNEASQKEIMRKK